MLIDLKGFESLVDAVGGITMDVYRRVPIGGGGSPISGYVEAGKNRHLDGREALWFARSRADSSDYDRIVRQKCVMTAMLDQLDPVTVLTKFNKIAAASKRVVATDIPAGRREHHARPGAQGQEAAGVQRGPDAAVDLSRQAGLRGGAPRGRGQDRGRRGGRRARRQPSGNPGAAPASSTKPKKKKKAKKAGQARTAQTDDLAKVCAA